MAESATIIPLDKPEFPSVEVWNDENDDELCENLKDKINDADNNSVTEISDSAKNSIADSFVEDTQVFKTYNNRRLSDSFPDAYNLAQDSTISTVIRKELSKLLSLMLVQGLTNNPVSEKGASKEREGYILNILQSLLTVSSAAINTPSETQIIEYCQNVLEVVAADASDSATVIYFFRNVLLSRDPMLKCAALALLCSYCSERKFDLSLAPDLLRDLIALYIDDDMKVLELSAKAVTTVIQNLKYTDKAKLVSDVCLAVKCAMFRSKEKYLPGLCHPEGFDSIFPMYEKVILTGIMKDKRIAVRALQQLILFSSEEALWPFLCTLPSFLSLVLVRYMYDICTLLKITLVETVTTLIAKVGIKLKPYFRRFEITLFRLIRCDDRTLQLKCIRALCCFARFDDQLDKLYDDIFDAVRRETLPIKKRILFTLRCIIKCACVPIPDYSNRKFTILVISLLNHQDDSCRIIAAGCIGTMFGYLPPPEFEKVLKLYFLDDDETLPWNVRHSKCASLMVALKESPAKLLQGELSEKITEVLLSYIISIKSKRQIIACGIKACGYYMLHKLQLEEEINPVLLDVFCETMKQPYAFVKYTFALVTNFLANRITLPLYVIKAVVPSLLNGTKNQNTEVKSSCEFALVAVLDLYKGEEIAQMYLNTLEIDAKESLQNYIANRLKAVSEQQKPKEKEFDFTLFDFTS